MRYAVVEAAYRLAQDTLVDAFDGDRGRHYIARRDDPRLTRPCLFSERERQVLAFAALGHSNKRIAHTLGLAPSKGSSHLQSARRRLGVRDTVSLMRAFLEPEHGA